MRGYRESSKGEGRRQKNKRQTLRKAYCEYYANWRRQSKWTPRLRHVVHVPKDAEEEEEEEGIERDENSTEK